MLRVLRLLFLVSALLLAAVGLQADAAVFAKKTPDGKWAFVPLADGFDFPVGKPDGKGYYKSRGLRLATPRHLGEDWNGNGGGNSDLGDPVYSIGLGLVTYADDARGRWARWSSYATPSASPRPAKCSAASRCTPTWTASM